LKPLVARFPNLQANRNVHPVRIYLFVYKWKTGLILPSSRAQDARPAREHFEQKG
jgi:hypothetical protein